jgi:hypothetical protein
MDPDFFYSRHLCVVCSYEGGHGGESEGDDVELHFEVWSCIWWMKWFEW